MTPEKLTGLDASFLSMETPTLHMHVAMVTVFDPATVPGGYSFRRIRQLIVDRIPLLPVFQRRLVEVPLRLGHPVWVDDPEFDIDNHLRRAALPSPGGMRELADFAADVSSRQLHRDRPLWEMWVVEALEDGKVALVAKLHHSTVDGASGAELLGVLFDLSPEPPEPAHQGERQLDIRVPSGFELVSHALVANLFRPLEIGRMAWRTTQALVDIRKVRQRGPGQAASPLRAPRTSINVAVHARRRVAFAAANLADVKKVKNAMGTTVNDVILAMCAGALRTYLLAGDELPDVPLVAVVPVSVTPEMAELKGSNKVSAMFVQLPSELDDPLERLRAIHEGTKGAKEEYQALGADSLQNWAEHATPNVFAAAARLYTKMKLADRHRPVANLIVSNVPGPDFPLYLGGGELLALFPLGPVMDGMGLNITIMSYRGVLYWGLASDARAVPRLWDIAAAIPAALTELVEAAGLAPDAFDVPLHLGPGMPPQARWVRSDSRATCRRGRDERHGDGVTVRELGHLVLYVHDVTRSAHFYREVLGWRQVMPAPGVDPVGVAAFSSGRTHHELLLIEVGAHASPIPAGRRVGMYHFGLSVGESDDDLRAILATLHEAGVTIVGASDHTVTHSLYIEDPDGNEIELYVDVPGVDWKTDPSLIMAPVRPLRL